MNEVIFKKYYKLSLKYIKKEKAKMNKKYVELESKIEDQKKDIEYLEKRINSLYRYLEAKNRGEMARIIVSTKHCYYSYEPPKYVFAWFDDNNLEENFIEVDPLDGNTHYEIFYNNKTENYFLVKKHINLLLPPDIEYFVLDKKKNKFDKIIFESSIEDKIGKRIW